MDFSIKVAGHIVGISTNRKCIYQLSSRYVTDLPAERTFEAAPEDIAREHAVAEQANKEMDKQQQPLIITAESLEWMSLHRQIAEYLLDFDVMLFHGSSVAVDGKCYMFMAPSGTGKSTHTALWMKEFGDRAIMVNGDKPFIHIAPEGVTLFGSPWDGKEHLSTNVGLPLQAIAIIHRGAKNHIEPVEKGGRMAELAAGAYVPESAASRLKAAILIDELLSQVGVYSLTCNMEPDAVSCAYEAMSGDCR